MKSIACIVVTYNRLNLLKRCVNSVRNQKLNDFDLFVINNGSTDGTKEWLESQRDLITINQDNLGGAGGFYTGMKTAYEQGYEWIWMMDDDGVADSSQLYELHNTSNNNGLLFTNALVINIDDPNKLSFGLQLQDKIIFDRQEALRHKYIDNINPFNGTYINRKLIDNIGLIKKEMFIWGDEKEYGLRAKSQGFKYYTITSAIHYHPTIKAKNENVFPFIGKIKVQLKPENFSHYYYRNIGFIYSTYYRDRVWRPLFAYTVYFLLRFKIRELKKFLKYYINGINNKF